MKIYHLHQNYTLYTGMPIAVRSINCISQMDQAKLYVGQGLLHEERTYCMHENVTGIGLHVYYYTYTLYM